MNYDAWLCSIPGLYWNMHAKLIEIFGSSEGVFEASGEELDRLEKEGLKWIGKVRSCRNERFIRSFEDELARKKIRFISASEKGFPPLLSQIKDCPLGLFYKGRLPSVEEKLAAVVGARACTPYGDRMAAKIASRLAREGYGIISGMALGIDGIAQKAAVEEGGKSYGVLGCGADICYPPENIGLYTSLYSNGGVISEFPCGTGPMPFHFPFRNRIISGMARAVIVIEARKKSGSLITADLALEQGRDVYALPGRVGDPLSEGCNILISQGSSIISSVEDLIFEMTGKEPAKESPQAIQEEAVSCLSGEQRSVWERIGNDPAGPEELSFRTGIPIPRLGRILTQLQMMDLIVYTPGSRYMRKQ